MVENIVAKKALGQNFLTDTTVAQFMVDSLGIAKADFIIEVGGGTGEVTIPLATACINNQAQLTVVEFDVDLIPVLKSKVTENEYVKIANANILNFLDDYEVPREHVLKVIGSLPYNITSPLIHRLFKLKTIPETCVFLVQKEVAQKITKQAPDSNYLAVFIQTFYKTELLRVVAKSLFSPTPEVDGAVVLLTKKPGSNIEDVSRYEKFLHRAFSHPRKMLNKIFTEQELEDYEFQGTKRAQDYNNEQYVQAFQKSLTLNR